MIDPQSPYNDLPWDLIVSALQGEPSPEEDVQFQQWLGLSPDNRSTYERLQRMWEEEMTDYAFYQQAGEVHAWEELRNRMGEGALSGQMGAVLSDEEVETRLVAIQGEATRSRRRIVMMRWAAVAAVLLLLAGGEWWYVSRKGEQYVTAAGETKQVSLPDGSMVGMTENTNIRVESGYDKTDRKLVLVSGIARFDVAHHPERPFEVEMGDVSVKDIGTSFTIERMRDSIKVSVWEGKVAMVRRETGETREITEGREETFYMAAHKFGEVGIRSYGLKFDGQTLVEVVAAMEKQSGRKIVLKDTAIAQRRLTVRLDGETLEDAIKTVCATLNLEYSLENGVYILRDAK